MDSAEIAFIRHVQGVLSMAELAFPAHCALGPRCDMKEQCGRYQRLTFNFYFYTYFPDRAGHRCDRFLRYLSTLSPKGAVGHTTFDLIRTSAYRAVTVVWSNLSANLVSFFLRLWDRYEDSQVFDFPNGHRVETYLTILGTLLDAWIEADQHQSVDLHHLP